MAPRGTYRQIADDLRLRLTSGELAPGAMVPSEHALASQHEVSRGTVRSALALLEDEGLIEPVPGQGRRVVGAQDEATSPTTAYERIAAELRRKLEAGEFAAGSPLPSEADLVDEYGVSRNTVRRAYRVLVDSGTVVLRQGSGAFPAPR